jgi:hypothetical protein
MRRRRRRLSYLLLAIHLFAAPEAGAQPEPEQGSQAEPPAAAPPSTTREARTEPMESKEGPSYDFSKPTVSFQLGMIQPLLLGGANVEADFRWGHLVVDYSHGWNLNLEGSAIVGEMKRQAVSLRVNYTTGLGIGYSQHVDGLRSFFEVRFEPKLHRFEASYGSPDESTKTAIASYNTVTLGGGFYWTLVPFSHRKDILRGLNVATSFRAWPKATTTLSGNEVAYDNKTTGRRETHSAANIGIADTPFFANISLGYIFQ